jgi:hypothetical protein
MFASSVEVTHTYSTAGPFAISATVTDLAGATAAPNLSVNVMAVSKVVIPPPTILVSGSSSGVDDVIDLTTTDTSNDSPITWNINWGDSTQTQAITTAQALGADLFKSILSSAHTFNPGLGITSVLYRITATESDASGVSQEFPLSFEYISQSNLVRGTSISGTVAGIVSPAHSSTPPATTTKLTAAAKRDLQDLGINTREVTTVVAENRFANSAIINDLPSPSEPGARAVSASRLDATRVSYVLNDVYRPIFYKENGESRRQEIRSELAEAISRYRGDDSSKPVDPAGFALYVHANAGTPEGAQVATDIQNMDKLARQIDTLGLNSAEAMQSKTYWTSHVTPTGLGLPPRWLLNVLDASAGNGPEH